MDFDVYMRKPRQLPLFLGWQPVNINMILPRRLFSGLYFSSFSSGESGELSSYVLPVVRCSSNYLYQRLSKGLRTDLIQAVVGVDMAAPTCFAFVLTASD